MKKILKLALALCSLFQMQQVCAQIYPMGALYFQNQYMSNPAMAGISQGLNLNLGYRKLWSSMPGSPEIQTFTGDYKINEKVGVGINIFNDKAGLLKRTRTVASYAYHLPLSNIGQKLSFGISIGFMNERLNYNDQRGDDGDVIANTYNTRETYVDGDFGIAYTDGKFNIQAALPNMKNFFNRDVEVNSVDRSVFFTSASYKTDLSTGATGIGVEPKVVFRGVKGFKNILDIGANLSYAENKLNLFGMYHSSESLTFGLGMNYQSLGLIGMYTTSTSALSSYSNGTFEVSLKLNLFN